MWNSNANNGLMVATATQAGPAPRAQQLNAGLVAALIALTCMVFSSTPGLIGALGDLSVSVPGVHAAHHATTAKAASAHAFRPAGNGVLAWRNKAAGLTGVVQRTGLTVRTAPSAPQVSLRSLALGRAAAMSSLAAVTPSATDETASLRHGNVIEWFQNRAGSLEQGWTIAKRPAGVGRLRLDLGISGAKVVSVGTRAL